MSFVGLVPSESSTGDHVSRGKITRAGNVHVRTLLVEAAWHHARSYSPTAVSVMSPAAAVSAEIAEKAARANRRLHSRCVHLRSRGKRSNIANIAVARELAGFVWAIGLMAQEQS